MAFDPRDNGKSDRPEELDQYSIEKIVIDVIAIMDDTNTKKAVLVGLSFSSAISFAVGAYYPERIAAVVSTGGWSPIVPPKKERFEAYKMHQRPTPKCGTNTTPTTGRRIIQNSVISS